MRSRGYIFGICLGLSFSQSAFADILSVEVEPIIGFERVQQVLPSLHWVNRLIYGARVTAGVLMIAAETEYTHGTLQEEFPGNSQSSISDRLKAGLRSGIRVGSLFSFTLRGGVQASITQTTQTIAGTSVTYYDPLRYDPYAGAVARVSLSSKMNASVAVVAVIRDINNLDQTEYQTTAGFALKFP